MRHFAYVLARLAIQGAVVMLLAAGPALAASDGINVVHVSLDPFEDGWAINAEFDVHLKPRMEEALVHGLPLYFVVDFELTRSRWYWFDEKAASASITYRLSFHELTRQYRLSTGSLQQGFATLGEAIGVMSHVHDWKVVEHGVLHPGYTYQAAIRMQHDTSQLPKPFQMDAFSNREWRLDSDWRQFGLEVPK